MWLISFQTSRTTFSIKQDQGSAGIYIVQRIPGNPYPAQFLKWDTEEHKTHRIALDLVMFYCLFFIVWGFTFFLFQLAGSGWEGDNDTKTS